MSGLSFQQIKKYYNLCRVDEVLKPHDPRNVNIDGGEDYHPRGVNWSARLAKEIERSDEPLRLFFSGLPGSGKSTELQRLMKRLEDTQRAHLLPIYIDAEAVLDLSGQIDASDVLLNIVYETERTVMELESKDPEQAMREDYGARLWHWLTTEVEATQVQAKVGVPGVGDMGLVLKMKNTPSFRQAVQVMINGRLSGFLAQVDEEMKALNKRAEDLGYKGLVVIFDSLEKLQGTSTTWRDVLISAEKLFHHDAPHLRLPVHVLYTVPPALIFRIKLQVEFMPMIKLRHKTGEPCEPGIAAARDLIHQRIEEDDLRALLGDSYERNLGEIIDSTGGYPREIVRFLRRMFRDAEPGEEMGQSIINQIIQESRDEYRRTITADAWPWLAKVAHTRSLLIESDEHREVVDRMMANNVILRYRNDKSWYDLHPALYGIPGIEAAIKALEALEV